MPGSANTTPDTFQCKAPSRKAIPGEALVPQHQDQELVSEIAPDPRISAREFEIRRVVARKSGGTQAILC